MEKTKVDIIQLKQQYMSCFYSNPGTYSGDPLSENKTLSKLDFDQNVSESSHEIN